MKIDNLYIGQTIFYYDFEDVPASIIEAKVEQIDFPILVMPIKKNKIYIQNQRKTLISWGIGQNCHYTLYTTYEDAVEHGYNRIRQEYEYQLIHIKDIME